MMAGGDGKSAVAGGLARHIPVLARQTFEQLGVHDGVYIDGTFGAGGHSGAILRVGGTTVIGIDRDRDAIAGGFALVVPALLFIFFIRRYLFNMWGRVVR